MRGGGGGGPGRWGCDEGLRPEGTDAGDEDEDEGGESRCAAGAFWDFCCASESAGASWGVVDASDFAEDDALFLYMLPCPPSLLFNAF